MKLRKPWLINLVGLVASWLIRGWISTLHLRLIQNDGTSHPADARRQRFIYAFWHESILFATGFRTRIHVLISHHADGELIAQACRHFRIKTVRGSTGRGGTRAMLEMINSSTTTHLLVTPDGPRGPRRRVQQGLIFLASHTGLPIVPCGVGYEKAWRFHSWDRFALPLPWTRAIGVVGRAIHVPAGLNRTDMDCYRQLVETRLLDATAEAERRATGSSASLQATTPCELRHSA